MSDNKENVDVAWELGGDGASIMRACDRKTVARFNSGSVDGGKSISIERMRSKLTTIIEQHNESLIISDEEVFTETVSETVSKDESEDESDNRTGASTGAAKKRGRPKNTQNLTE